MKSFGHHTAEPDAGSVIRHLIAEIIRHCPKSRQQIAAEMAVLLGRKVSHHMLNDFTAPGKSRVNFPAAFVRAFSEVTSDDRLERYLAGPRLGKLILIAEHDIVSVLEEFARATLRKRAKKGKATK
ncbi:MAG: hypothetical protein LAO06_02570 [Acidobacteriia bacterium]|nr:hypothetical protein [Terriglobia bacterium]